MRNKYHLIVFPVGETVSTATSKRQGTFEDYEQALTNADRLLYALDQHQALVIEVKANGQETGRGWRRTSKSSWGFVDMARGN